MDQRSKVRIKTLRLLEENMGKKLHDIGFGNDWIGHQKHGQQN